MQVSSGLPVAHYDSAFSTRVLDCVDDDRSGFPPCLVFERGEQNLSEWLKSNRSSYSIKSVLNEVHPLPFSHILADLCNRYLVA